MPRCIVAGRAAEWLARIECVDPRGREQECGRTAPPLFPIALRVVRPWQGVEVEVVVATRQRPMSWDTMNPAAGPLQAGAPGRVRFAGARW